MCQKGRQIDEAGSLVHRRGLDGGNLMLAERLTYDIETAGQRGITEGSFLPTSPSWLDGGGERISQG